jgi:hypothetical protein
MDNDMDNDTKIILTSSESKYVKTTKDKKKRAITNTEKWCFRKNEKTLENEMEWLNDLVINNSDTEISRLIIQQIQYKINSYKYQDINNNKYNFCDFIDVFFVLQEMIKCNMNCFYCNEKMELLYENSREPRQWTLERIDNCIGHIKHNVVIACLSCNIKRRCIYHERYYFTKQLKIIKKI